MAQQLELAFLLLVFHSVEEGSIVGSPYDGTDSLHFPLQRFAGFKILDVQRVLGGSR